MLNDDERERYERGVAFVWDAWFIIAVTAVACIVFFRACIA